MNEKMPKALHVNEVNTLPGEDLTDEEFLQSFTLTYSRNGSLGFIGPGSKNEVDYLYAYFPGGPSNRWMFWGEDSWVEMDNSRIINLLKMAALPEVVE